MTACGLASLGAAFIELGARGVAYGFLDRDLEIDRRACAEMCAELGGVPWLFHGFDTALDVQHAWRDVIGLPGLESVITAGSTRGLAHGADDLIMRAKSDPRVAELTTAGGGLTPDAGAVAGPGRRTPVRDRLLGARGRLVDARLGGRRPGAGVADARRRRALPSPGPAGGLTRLPAAPLSRSAGTRG